MVDGGEKDGFIGKSIAISKNSAASKNIAFGDILGIENVKLGVFWRHLLLKNHMGCS